MARPRGTAARVTRALRELERRGLLLQADARLPSVATQVAGEPIRGSWWAHPSSNQIYWVLVELEDHPDVLRAKLVNGKLTLVHRRLWPALHALGTSDEPWQRRDLAAGARRLLQSVERRGTLRTDEHPGASGEPSRALERRLLVMADEVHTESGRHAKQLESWTHWHARRRPGPSPGSIDAARSALESALPAPAARFPWSVR